MREFDDSHYVNRQRDLADRALKDKVKDKEHADKFPGEINRKIWRHLSEVHGVLPGTQVSVERPSEHYTGTVQAFNPDTGKVTIVNRIDSDRNSLSKPVMMATTALIQILRNSGTIVCDDDCLNGVSHSPDNTDSA